MATIAVYEVRFGKEIEIVEFEISQRGSMVAAECLDFEGLFILCRNEDINGFFKAACSIIKNMYAQEGHSVAIRYKGAFDDEVWYGN